MISFTKQERMVVFIFVTVFAVGSGLKMLFIKYPQLKDSVNLIEGEHLYLKVDVNTASYEELLEVPYIGQYTAQSILELRRKNGGIHSLEELKAIKGVREESYQKFISYLKIIKP